MRAITATRPSLSSFSRAHTSTAARWYTSPSSLAHAEPAPPSRRDLIRSRIAQVDAVSSTGLVSPFLVDTFGRRHNYLRISLTERCNLRCFYCMPSEGVELSPKSNILSDDEIIRLATLFVKSGVTKIRLTGGEPTVRKGLVDLVARLNGLREYGLESIGMTSNGLVLHRNLSNLVQSGLTHLNLSLDTLDPFKFEIMTRRMGHEAVLRSLDHALASNLKSVKMNVVIVKGLNDNEVLDFVDMTKDRNLSIRFIEFMPFTGNQWDKAKMVPSSELLSRISAVHPSLRKAADELNDTARSYRIPGNRGSIGFISSMSDHFCASCNRLRLTADGQIKVCLFDAKEVSLRDQMRQGADDAHLLRIIGRAVNGKKEKHDGMEDIDVVTNRPMILIGAIRLASRATYTWASRSARGARRNHLWSPTTVPPALCVGRVRSLSTKSAFDSSHQPEPKLTHVDAEGRPHMVDVSNKESTSRTATAEGRIYLPRVAYELVSTTTIHAPAPLPTSRLGSEKPKHPGKSVAPDRAPDPAMETYLGLGAAVSELETAKSKARKKGDVLIVAQLAAIMACKRTAELIPLCHPLPLSHVSVALTPEVHPDPNATRDLTDLPDKGDTGRRPHLYSIKCTATVSCDGKTGVEMEALTAVSVGLLTVWDMLKAVAGKEMVIGDILVRGKAGGKSGDFVRQQ